MNAMLMEEREHTKVAALPRFSSDPDNYRSTIIDQYFGGITRLAEDILHILALAQEIDQNQRPEWRTKFLGPNRYLGLRYLVYHPGPLSENSVPVTTTARHTDATWVTLIEQDLPGLRCRTREGDWIDIKPAPGAIVVNTGNVLEEQSGGYYKAVCHKVERKSEVDTRISLCFFYDWLGSSTKGC
jgi:isopenicillin N synthase-like dioxygenase